MPQFRFKLKSVLRHREIIEQSKQRDYALALGKSAAEGSVAPRPARWAKAQANSR